MFMILSAGPEVGITSLPDRKVGAGAKMRLMCVLMEGDPPVTFHWTIDGKPVEAIAGLKVDSLESASSVLISKANEAHTGNYTCVATNPVGSSSVVAEILVNGNQIHLNFLIKQRKNYLVCMYMVQSILLIF